MSNLYRGPSIDASQGWIQDLKSGVGGRAHLKKLCRAEGGAKIFGVFRVKNHDFTPKNHMFSNFRGARAGCAPPGSAPASYQVSCHLAKGFRRKSCFRNRPIRNKNCLWRPCLLTDKNGMSNFHRCFLPRFGPFRQAVSE